MFLINNGRIEKDWKSFVVAPPENKPLVIDQTFNNGSAPIYYLKNDLISFQFKKREAQKTNHSIGPRVSLCILVCVSTVYTRLKIKNTHYGWGSC